MAATPITQFDDAAFSIRLAPPRKYVEIDLRGHWDEATAARFGTELRRLLPVLRTAGCRIGDQVTLIDMTTYQAQSQSVLGMLGSLAADRSIGSRRIAVIMTSALVKQQARRIAPHYGLFTDRVEATRWLFSPDAQ